MTTKARTIRDEVLGPLTWNTDLDWWEGRVELSPGHPLSLSLSVEDEDATADPVREIAHGRRILLFLREHEPEARLVAADELLEIYNAEWNEGEPLDEEEFMDRLTLDDVNVSFDGSAELFYLDDGLFAGHTVVVTVDANGNFADADVAG
jgi:hypothetical protein